MADQYYFAQIETETSAKQGSQKRIKTKGEEVIKYRIEVKSQDERSRILRLEERFG